MNVSEWLEHKYPEWERGQSSRQSYYQFARYLDVNHTSLTQWASGTAQPAGDDLAKLAAKLGPEIYPLVGAVPPGSKQAQDWLAGFSSLPAAFRQHLAGAVAEVHQQIAARRLDPESADAKILTVKIFDKWGFRVSS
jgi:hypothetical protein